MSSYYPQYRLGNPYGSLGPSPATVRRITPRKPASPSRSLSSNTLTSLLASIPSVLTDDQARSRAMSLLQPIFDQENARLNAAYDARRNAVQQAYAALAQYAQGVAPAVQGAYSSAAKDTAAFGKGFSDAIQQASQGQANTATAALAAQGSPQTVTSGMTGGGADALYAMGGSIPASALEREGAAFGSAASFLPATSAAYGAQAIGDLEQQRTQDLADLAGQRPSTVLDLINQLVDRSSSQRQDALSLAMNQRDFNYRAKQDTLSRKDAAAKTRQDNLDRQYEAAALKQAYGYPLTARDKRLLNTYGTTPEAVKTAGDAKLERQNDARSRAKQDAQNKATAARQAASDARRAKLSAQTAAQRSGLEKDKAKYRMALERYKAAQRKALAAQKTANSFTKKPKKKSKVGNPGDSADRSGGASTYFGG